MPTIEFDPNTGKRLTAGQSVVFGGRSYKQGSTEVGGTALPLLPPEDKSKLANTDNTISNLGNFRTVLRSALNEATNLRAQSSLKQLAPLSEGAPGGMKFLADALKTMEIRPSAETAFSDAMEARKDEIARLREEGKAPEIIGSAETGYYQWDKTMRSWMPASGIGAARAGEGAISDDTWLKLIKGKQVDVGDKGLKGGQRDRVLSLLSDEIPDFTNPKWVKKEYEEALAAGDSPSVARADMLRAGVPKKILDQIVPEPVRKVSTTADIETSAESIGEYFPESLLETFLAPGKAFVGAVGKAQAAGEGFLKGLTK